eukprot:TRINITY_DN4186_c2_g1_i1.p4 TRINITY_DN4186_c2_g1~~TRINITY_DN4186_c2_g1_i1.p4  ORF type:complete len:149 (-),score=1.62 TRINITY_DN4186_c2_g1_i1:9-455(-)
MSFKLPYQVAPLTTKKQQNYSIDKQYLICLNFNLLLLIVLSQESRMKVLDRIGYINYFKCIVFGHYFDRLKAYQRSLNFVALSFQEMFIFFGIKGIRVYGGLGRQGDIIISGKDARRGCFGGFETPIQHQFGRVLWLHNFHPAFLRHA